MKALLFASCVIIASHSLTGQTQHTKLVLTIESTSSATPHIPFSMSYAEGDTSAFDPLIFEKNVTPFTMEFHSSKLILLVTDSTRGEGVSVRLQQFINGKKVAEVSGQNSLHLLRAEERNLSYGWPKVTRTYLREKK